MLPEQPNAKLMLVACGTQALRQWRNASREVMGIEEVLVALAAQGQGAVDNPVQGGVDGMAVGESAT
jgi:hypothetical protein